MNWTDGTPKSIGNAFEWNTGEPTVFARDPYFQAKGKTGMTTGQIASLSRENAEADGKDVATVHGIGQLVIDKLNSKAFHVHRPAKRKQK